MTKAQKQAERRKHRGSEFRNLKLEKTFIGCILKDIEIFRRIVSSFNCDVLSSDRIRWIYEAIQENYNRYGTLLDTESFKHVLDIEHKNKRTYTALWKSIVSVSKTKKPAVALVIKEKLQKLYQARVLELGIKETLIELTEANKGQLKRVETAVRTLTEASERANITDVPVIVTDPLTKFEEYINHHRYIQKNPEEAMGIPTGIGSLDRIMGGLRKSELGLITAGTGVGKSIIMLDMAVHAWKVIGDVAYITIEMPEEQLRQRFYCHLSHISYEKFRRYMLDKSDEKRLRRIIKRAQSIEQKFNIIDMPESCTVDMIKVEIEKLMRKREIKAVFVDYLNIIASDAGNISLNWESQIATSIQLKQKIARYFQLPTWTANQLSGSSDGKEFMTRKDMAFAKNILDNVDVGFYIVETEDSKVHDTLKCGFLKTRDFQGQDFTIKDNREFMRFSEYTRGGAINEKKKIDVQMEIKT